MPHHGDCATTRMSLLHVAHVFTVASFGGDRIMRSHQSAAAYTLRKLVACIILVEIRFQEKVEKRTPSNSHLVT